MALIKEAEGRLYLVRPSDSIKVGDRSSRWRLMCAARLGRVLLLRDGDEERGGRRQARARAEAGAHRPHGGVRARGTAGTAVHGGVARSAKFGIRSDKAATEFKFSSLRAALDHVRDANGAKAGVVSLLCQRMRKGDRV